MCPLLFSLLRWPWVHSLLTFIKFIYFISWLKVEHNNIYKLKYIFNTKWSFTINSFYNDKYTIYRKSLVWFEEYWFDLCCISSYIYYWDGGVYVALNINIVIFWYLVNENKTCFFTLVNSMHLLLLHIFIIILTKDLHLFFKWQVIKFAGICAMLFC